MKRVVIALAAAWALMALAAPAEAQGRYCCRVRAGTVVEITLAEHVGTKYQRTGDPFAFRLAEPLVVDGRVVARAGTPGVGEVIDSARPGMGGKPAKMVLAARYLQLRRGRVPLQGLQLAAIGKNNTMAAQAVGLSGIAFGPLGFIGLAVPGGNVDFPAGTDATAEIAADVTMPSLGWAPRGMVDAPIGFDTAADEAAAIPLPPPPAGMGEVVFFRAKTLLGTGQWFNVRENGQALGKLSNGAYFIMAATPGVHTYTAVTEPEAKDNLKLEVDPGQIYFVEGILTKGVAIGVPDLTPSDRAAFDKASKHLKLAPLPGATRDVDDLSQYPLANSATDDGR